MDTARLSPTPPFASVVRAANRCWPLLTWVVSMETIDGMAAEPMGFPSAITSIFASVVPTLTVPETVNDWVPTKRVPDGGESSDAVGRVRVVCATPTTWVELGEVALGDVGFVSEGFAGHAAAVADVAHAGAEE